MDNIKYNSLTEKLILDGIIPSEENNNENIFSAKAAKTSAAQETPEIKTEIKSNKKRLNNYDLELLNNVSKQKSKNISQKSTFFEKILSNFFPKLYKAKLIKEAMAKLIELNIDTNVLLDKTIPYGESEIRYKDLIKYLNYANEIQVRLNKK